MNATGAYASTILEVVTEVVTEAGIEAGAEAETEVVSGEAEVVAVAEAVLVMTVVVMAVAAVAAEDGPETVVGALEVEAQDQTPGYVLLSSRTTSYY